MIPGYFIKIFSTSTTGPFFFNRVSSGSYYYDEQSLIYFYLDLLRFLYIPILLIIGYSALSYLIDWYFNLNSSRFNKLLLFMAAVAYTFLFLTITLLIGANDLMEGSGNDVNYSFGYYLGFGYYLMLFCNIAIWLLILFDFGKIGFSPQIKSSKKVSPDFDSFPMK